MNNLGSPDGLRRSATQASAIRRQPAEECRYRLLKTTLALAEQSSYP
jgi:hypothetical protein